MMSRLCAWLSRPCRYLDELFCKSVTMCVAMSRPFFLSSLVIQNSRYNVSTVFLAFQSPRQFSHLDSFVKVQCRLLRCLDCFSSYLDNLSCCLNVCLNCLFRYFESIQLYILCLSSLEGDPQMTQPKQSVGSKNRELCQKIKEW